MILGDLLERVSGLLGVEPAAPMTPAWRERVVTGVEYDSRRVTPGAVFVALKGQKADGAVFAQQAIVKGAVAAIGEGAPPPGWQAPWLRVPDARAALAAAAAVFFGHPADDLLVVGITGTNGKTTTSYLVSAIFDEAGVRCGRIGTVSYDVGGVERDAPRTTPEASDLQRMLREMAANGCGACAAEVSSHALVLKRVDYMRFAAAVFTNLTRDHLDFHGDMASYFAAKHRLFELLPPTSPACVNVDDPYGARLAAEPGRHVTYGIDQPADVNAGPFDLSLEGLQFEIRTPRGALDVRSPLPGRPNVYNILAATAVAVGLDLPQRAMQQGIARVTHVPGRPNVYNILAAVATGVSLGIPTADIESGIANLAGVPGRFEVASAPSDDVTVVVDYAHTDDALKNLLETVRGLAPQRVITVFGCGGDRDRTKRPLMGTVAGRLSDVVIVTSDNPRSEDPAAIIEEVMRGMPQPGDRVVQVGTGREVRRGPLALEVVERGAAIHKATELAEPGDLIVLAGKGHEKTQTIGDRTQPFDDVEAAREALARRRSRMRVG